MTRKRTKRRITRLGIKIVCDETKSHVEYLNGPVKIEVLADSLDSGCPWCGYTVTLYPFRQRQLRRK